MRAIIFLFMLVFVTGCTQTVDVPEDKYGLLFKTGKIIKTVSGPAVLEKRFPFERVGFIPKKDTVELARGRFVVHYSITEPEKYYRELGSSCRFYRRIEKELANHALAGKLVNTHVLLFEMIDSMGLPIKLDKVVDADVEIMEF